MHVLVKIEKDNYVTYTWNTENGTKTQATMMVKNKGNSTRITVNEKNMKNDEAGDKWLKSNRDGRADFRPAEMLVWNMALTSGKEHLTL